jgi:hypothetical protein
LCHWFLSLPSGRSTKQRPCGRFPSAT